MMKHNCIKKVLWFLLTCDFNWNQFLSFLEKNFQKSTIQKSTKKYSLKIRFEVFLKKLLMEHTFQISVSDAIFKFVFPSKLDLETRLFPGISLANGLFSEEDYWRCAYFGKEIFEKQYFYGKKKIIVAKSKAESLNVGCR